MSDLERRISATVERTRKDRDLRPEVICAAADFSRASYYVRINQGGWKLTELEGLADFYGKSLSEFISWVSESACTSPLLISDNLAWAA
jgi:hypothetical protein